MTDTPRTGAPRAGAPAAGTPRADTANHVAEVTACVADHVRALRVARSWSLDELAARSGVSKGMVVQIEAGRTNPSIGTLCRLADAFGVTIARLVEAAPERRVRLTDLADAPTLWRGERDGFGRLLAGLAEPACLELWEWRFAPGERHRSDGHAPGTREMLHVLAGQLTVTVDGADHRVRTGQTIDFAADRTHTYRNDGTGTARLIMVVAPPADEWDRRSARDPATGPDR
ncbi:helix-turn-helix domain-containing protein [Rhizomonospora bruguierae]|uniref:helix-turn-helix domain-containing protein n=1 Tax=Rhizomonospora bruguierae TaxID=1581705 RepID=UPI0020BF3FED|nr:XRE family transcriptional regulator [Micromonospora sp. NBRC 107566]